MKNYIKLPPIITKIILALWIDDILWNLANKTVVLELTTSVHMMMLWCDNMKNMSSS